jgi:hypothetical protein
VPVGPLDIVAVKVTEPPYVDGLLEDATLSVGVALFTVWVMEFEVTAL